MSTRKVAIVLVALVVACMGEPGGGGVNIPSSTILASLPAPDTTTTTAAITTTTLSPTTITTTTLPPTTTTTVPTIQLSGRVMQEDGSPIARALVTMGDRRQVSGPDGWFSFEAPSPGLMTVSKPGWSSIDLEWDDATTFLEAIITPVTIRGLRVAAGAAADDRTFNRLLTLADETAVNALVFDSKQDDGRVVYDTTVRVAHEIGAVDVFYDPVERIAQAHEHDLYTVTRIVSFGDPFRASAFPKERLTGPWLDPSSKSARRYLLDLAAEACELGFDEVQFDYVRYPSGRTADLSGQRDLTQEQRLAAVSGFLANAREMLHPMGCAVSAAVFGIVVSSSNDQGIGQRPEEISAQVDTFSPMVYPSHYSNGWLGFDDPNDHPYEVTADAIDDAMPRLHEGTRLRPYLQAFWWTNSQIRESIQAAEDAGIGWLLWNIRSNFDRQALPSDEEVNGQ